MYAATAFAVTACVVTHPVFAQGVGDFDPRLRPAVQELLDGGDADYVLHHLQLGVQALEIGQREVAARSFDEALAGITSVYADSERAAKARSLWYEEGSKDYKGEPYERAMAFYYRGLIDLMEGDYENARASFRSGLMQDAFAEEEQHQADFAMLLYLDGWSSFLLGDSDLAAEAFEEALMFRPDLPLPEEGDNVLVIAESGKSPRKLADGIGHNILVYRRGKRFKEQRAELLAGGEGHGLYPLEDIFWQATTRGGRPVDGILEGQVKFRSSAEGIGTVLTDVASASTENSLAYSGSGSGTANVVGVVGIVALAFASRAKTKADTRYWNNLPDAVHVDSMKVTAGEQPDWSVRYLDKFGNPVPEMERPVDIHWDERGNGVVWVRSRYSVEP